jgi:hypothetical protein
MGSRNEGLFWKYQQERIKNIKLVGLEFCKKDAERSSRIIKNFD